MSISKQLIKWYKHHNRPLPWRETCDPYKIWLSEIMLQQTRVEQGLPYYQRFTEKFLTITDLANAPDEQVMKLWQGLGYYSRARNMLAAARIVRDRFGGQFPSDYQLIRNLPGVGDYTAAAIASFAFQQPYAVIDGNVIRVLSRIFGVETPVDSPKGKKIIAQFANELFDYKNPAIYNQAIMEFGAVVCKPAKPECETCFLQNQCDAFKNNLVKALPVKSKKIKVKTRYFNYLLIRQNNSVILNKRGAGDIWENLFDLPMIESTGIETPEKLMLSKEWKSIFKNESLHINKVYRPKVHKLTHQHIYASVIDISIQPKAKIKKSTAFITINSDQVKEYAVPKLIQTILEESIEGYHSH